MKYLILSKTLSHFLNNYRYWSLPPSLIQPLTASIYCIENRVFYAMRYMKLIWYGISCAKILLRSRKLIYTIRLIVSTVFDLSFSYIQKDPFYKSNQLLVITARHHKILEHKFSYNFCSASFFYQKLFIELFMIIPHVVRTQVKAVVFLSIVAGKMFLLSSLKNHCLTRSWIIIY